MAEKESSESGRLRISGISDADAERNQRERRRAVHKRRCEVPRSLIYMKKQRSLRYKENQLQLSFGFDLDPGNAFELVKSTWHHDYEIALYGRLGLHCHNFQKGTNFKFVRCEKYCPAFTSESSYYITLEAMDPATDSVFSFQTLVSDIGCANGINTWLRTLACRIKRRERIDEDWGDTAIDAFYKGPMPKWYSANDLASYPKRFYEVQESDLLENDWLHLFSEIGFFSEAKQQVVAPPSLEIKKVVIETKEEYTTEAREKLMAENAIFYISYKYTGDDPLTRGLAGDHNAVLRKTMDGIPGHMCIEVAGEN